MNNMTLITSQITLPYQANGAGNVHGGEIMKLMDTAAGSLAMKYSKGNCVTARMDEVDFRLPIFIGSLVTCTATIDFVGTTSMEIFVSVESENLISGNGPKKVLSAYFTLVAMGSDGKPRKVPEYQPQTEDEIQRYEAAKARREQRQANRSKR
ncbi:MAG: acyl-CoA thioesterase [Lawsonibacter sp.]|nr:acyl-CoA thioesterase [Lawsonibacter sp.]